MNATAFLKPPLDERMRRKALNGIGSSATASPMRMRSTITAVPVRYQAVGSRCHGRVGA
jgi:hypothetical protein